jgi:hypothetical protein
MSGYLQSSARQLRTMPENKSTLYRTSPPDSPFYCSNAKNRRFVVHKKNSHLHFSRQILSSSTMATASFQTTRPTALRGARPAAALRSAALGLAPRHLRAARRPQTVKVAAVLDVDETNFEAEVLKVRLCGLGRANSKHVCSSAVLVSLQCI